ncbi:hypothetical protein HK101_010416 [Irineochytrium annulatum]|nr:hypothetical protein HK101_010416 [Irineochytrium annulatum]
MAASLLVAIRIHRSNAGTEETKETPDLAALSSAVDRALLSAGRVAVLAPSYDAKLWEALRDYRDQGPGFDLIGVSDWGNFIPALNTAVMHAAREGWNFLCFRSVEVDARPNEIQAMLRMLEDDTLVVGKRLKGHVFAEGQPSLTGATTPWNTLAIWRVQKLALTGFLLVAEGFEKMGTVGGVEEVSVIAMHQRLHPTSSKAKLVSFLAKGGAKADADWDTEWKDEGRREWHERKMASKVSRPAKHLELLGLVGDLSGVVDHIVMELG